MADRALVVFSGQTDLAWQRLLCPGFRHCSLILEEGSDWLLVEPLATRLQVRRLGLASVDLQRRLTRAGLTVVETARRPPSDRPAPPGLWTCVETVKRGLGIRALWVQTPWQLYRYLGTK
ncbi:MAG: hypothetical protein KDC18_18025 [Alphaproteobacteria bacterium]|nr:hypothetical protein [Alphaproteobacteria bacterium]MCB9928868.1 hypothetical protein [Alphaproteobacteria bacterium]